jgi:hypothetical protein
LRPPQARRSLQLVGQSVHLVEVDPGDEPKVVGLDLEGIK